jgi:integrase
MARMMNRLTTLKVVRAKNPGMYADGGGLNLQVSKTGTKSWVYRYMLNRRAREMGLGPFPTITLAEAREAAREAGKLRYKGIDPIKHRRDVKAQQLLDDAKAMTFKQCADAYIADHRKEWRNAKHAAQWETTLAYAGQGFGNLPVQSIDMAIVLKVLRPIWAEKPATASRLRGRIETVLDWAKVSGYRAGENPARWRGHLDKMLPARSKVSPIEHHAALPYTELPGFLVALREQQGIAARALEFIILTAARSGEVLGARWSEVNLLDKVWTVPAKRMKAKREHRVPLSDGALAVLQKMQALRPAGDDDPYVFPGGKEGKPLSNTAMLELRQRMGRTSITVHGFRSTFRDWAAERTNFPREIAEMALAHVVGGKSELAYWRSDLFEKRRKLMQQWETFCTTEPVEHGKVVALQGR